MLNCFKTQLDIFTLWRSLVSTARESVRMSVNRLGAFLLQGQKGFQGHHVWAFGFSDVPVHVLVCLQFQRGFAIHSL
mgnify:FL=1